MGVTPGQTIAVLGLLGIFAAVVYGFALWVVRASCSLDPWGKEIEDAINREDAVAVCHHCFTPEPQRGWFCPECGAVVGQYSNWMPYLYVFSEGEVLRAGVSERLRHGPVIVIGYLLVSIGMFAIAAPIYWVFLFKNLTRSEPAQRSAEEPERGQPAQGTTPVPPAEVSGGVKPVNKCTWCGRVYSAETTTCPIDGHPVLPETRA